MSPATRQEPRGGWKGSLSVRDWLFREPWQFEFFQAIRLLETLYPDRIPPGEGTGPDDEVVRLTSRISLEFPASELQELVESRLPGEPPTLVCNLLSVAGPSGPLPEPDTELVLARLAEKDTALRDFLDIFHHRLLSLLVRVRKAHDPSFTVQPPDEGQAAQHLYSFFGMGHAALRNRLRVDDRSLLFYAGILSHHPRSAAGLERMLSDYFQAPVRARQLVGKWCRLEPDQWTHLGASGRNQVLGRNAILGTKVWDQTGGFELDIGPLRSRQFLEFLPIGSAYRPLCELTRYYSGETFQFDFRLTHRAPEMPRMRLQRDSWLGWTTWLNTKGFKQDDSQVRLRPWLTSAKLRERI